MSRYCSEQSLASATVFSPGMQENGEAPVSKTMQYKKITKPLLERRRRARINACLDELKDIMTVALQAEGENVSKLEKADILELTVRHLQKLNQAQRLVLGRSPVEDIARFRQGFHTCAQEAASFLVSSPGVDLRVGQRLLSHVLGTAAPPPLSPPPPPSIQALVQHRMLSSMLSTSPPTCAPPSSSPHKPVPVKPSALRPALHPALGDSVWKPYS